MSAPPRDRESFFAEAAAILNVEPTAITSETRVIDDAGVDSLALAELLAVLVDQLGPDALGDSPEQREWRGVTFGQLFAEASTRGR